MKFLSVEKVGEFLSRLTKKSLDGVGGAFSSYSDLDAAINSYTFSAEGNRLGSIIRIKGLRKFATSGEYQSILKAFAEEMLPYLKDPKHKLQFTFTFDPDVSRVKERLRSLYKGAYVSMENIGLNLQDIYDSNIEKLSSRYCVITDLYLCVWTLPYGTGSDVVTLYQPDTDQSPKGRYQDSVLNHHVTLVKTIPFFLDSIGVDSSLLNIDEAMLSVRKRANPYFREDWKPKFHQDEVLPVFNSDEELLQLMPDRLSRQVSPGYCELPSFEKVVINNHIIARSLDVYRFGAECREFSVLLNNIAKAAIPARLTYTITGGGAGHSRFKYNRFQSALSTPSDEKRSLNYLNSVIANHSAVVGIQLTASTWVDVDEGYSELNQHPDLKSKYDKKLNRNYQTLVSHVSSWGGMEPDTKGDTPLYMWTRNNAGYSSQSDAHISFAPIQDAFKMIPMQLMSPIWTDSASMVFRTQYKEIIPFNRMASNQKYSFITIIGAMRSGKSVILNGLFQSLAVFPGLKELPCISIIDVGQTSFGGLDLIRGGLIDSKKHQVVKYILQNKKDHAINPFHLPMGLRVPVQSKKDNLISFMKLLNCDEDTAVTKGTEGLLSALVDATYRRYNDLLDNTDPKIYSKGRDIKLDKWLGDVNYNYENREVTYWELFDFFFENEDYKKAHYCQECASPLLADFINVANSSEFQNAYSKQPELIRLCSEIVTSFYDAIRLYPILSDHSFLNLDEARILAIDLGDVATSGPGSIKKVAIMYSLAMDVAVRNFFITEETLKEIPEEYRYYHTEKYNKIKSQPKGLYMDEVHRATGGNHHSPIAQLTMKQILDYVRVASKEQIEFVLSTHLVGDITPELLELSSTNMVLSVSPKGADDVMDAFGIDKSYKGILPKLGNPSRHGSLMLVQNETNESTYTHVVFNTVSAVELWSKVSYRIDVLIRDGLYKLLPQNVARAALAQRFPSCTAKAEAENYAGDLDDISVEQESNLVEKLIDEAYEIGKNILISS